MQELDLQGVVSYGVSAVDTTPVPPGHLSRPLNIIGLNLQSYKRVGISGMGY